MNTPLEVVRSFYEAVARSDLPVMLDLLDDKIEWIERFPGLHGTWHGAQEIVDHVFKQLPEEWDGFVIEPQEYIVEGGRIAVIGTYSGTYKKTGRMLSTHFVHLWTILRSKVLEFDQFTDTAEVLEAMASNS